MKRWLWHARRIATAAGAPGWLGLAMIAAAVLLQLSLIRPAEREISGLQSAIIDARAYPAAVNLPAGPAQQLAHFHDFFPAYQSLSQQLHALHEVTSEQQLSMGKVDYRLSSVNDTSLKRYEVAYSLVTDYPSLRMYLAALLKKLPNAALKDIELQRFSDDAAMLEARLNLVLYLRDDHAIE